ncbi:SDR family oxidoreductase [Roseomonas sp. JC162]|uniref:SDR family oxidoreductase n=1 Tax=Neoroseomonas marina TaxID=1232220 RepID=A0A848ELM4_9PROT|nr:SDR family oxidoreductase [Neoroseomonas marina]
MASQLPGTGYLPMFLPATDSAAIRAAASEIEHRLERVDVLVDSAGMTRAVPHGDLEGMDDETFDRILITNVRDPFAVIRAFLPLLRLSGDAVVVNISSFAALKGEGSSVPYAGSKAALDTMGKSLALVLAPQIRIMGIAPAGVDTDFIPGAYPGRLSAAHRTEPVEGNLPTG